VKCDTGRAPATGKAHRPSAHGKGEGSWLKDKKPLGDGNDDNRI